MNPTSPPVAGAAPRADGSPRRSSGRTRLAAATSVALLGGLLVPGTSSAAVTVGENITVFPDRDMVVAVGYPLGDELTVEVLRNGVVIGTTTGPAVETDEGIGLEVNHGPDAAPQAGDCWTGYTPDIVGGDVVRVTSSGGVDTTSVVPLAFSGVPYADPSSGTYHVSVEGTGVRGTTFAVELRNDDVSPRFRPLAGAPVWTSDTTWKATYRGATAADRDKALLGATSWMATAELISETTLAELGEPGGVGPGCTGSADPNALAGGLDQPVNIASGGITLSGTAREAVDAVNVTVGGLGPLPATLSAPTSGVRTWSLDVSKAQLLTLPDGTITVTPRYDTLTGPSRSLLKDTVAPEAPTSSPAPGDYTATQSVTLRRAVGEPSSSVVRWEIGADASSAPEPDQGSFAFTATSPAISVSTSQTIKARVYDAAGNPGALSTLDYFINRDRTPPPAPDVSPADGTFHGPQRVAITNVEPGVTIRYSAGTDPVAPPSVTAGTAYSGPFSISTSQTVVAVAFDAAGNASPATRRVYTITQAPAVAPDVTPESGAYTSAQQLVMSSTEPGVTSLRYTTGTAVDPPADPTATTGRVYTGPVTISTSQVVKVAAFNAAGRGPVLQRDYTFTLADTTRPPAPTVTPASGTYTTAQSVTMADAEADAVIRYTVGTLAALPPAPTATSPQYSGAIRVSSSSVIKAAAFDAAGNRSAVTRRDYTINTPTNAAPTITARTPGADVKGVSVGKDITATFSEAVSGVSTSTFRVVNPAGNAVAATVTRNGTTNQWMLNPSASLAADTRYTVRLTGGATAIRDAAGAPLATTSWSFLTGPRPTVTGRTPASGATSVSRTADVTATFSEAVTGTSTSTVTLRTSTGTANISAVVSYHATTRTVTLDPSATLAARTTYRLSLRGSASAIRDVAGNPLTSTSWTFTTGG